MPWGYIVTTVSVHRTSLTFQFSVTMMLSTTKRVPGRKLATPHPTIVLDKLDLMAFLADASSVPYDVATTNQGGPVPITDGFNSVSGK